MKAVGISKLLCCKNFARHLVPCLSFKKTSETLASYTTAKMLGIPSRPPPHHHCNERSTSTLVGACDSRLGESVQTAPCNANRTLRRNRRNVFCRSCDHTHHSFQSEIHKSGISWCARPSIAVSQLRRKPLRRQTRLAGRKYDLHAKGCRE